MAGPSRKISAASARSHTRKKARGGSSFFHRGMLKTLSSVLFIGIIAWSYQAIQPPPAKICGSQDGPRVTAPRIKLKDGRHLAYLENGVPKETAKYKIVFIHGFDCCRYDVFSISPALIEELGIYLLSFDRAGYGESDPNPKMTEKNTALDIEELADQLGLGTQFFVIGFSIGGEIAWTTLKYIPHRLAGAAIVAPAFNYWWHGFPSNLTTEAYNLLFPQDKWALRVTHYAPWLTYWWNTQKWFPGSSLIYKRTDSLSPSDLKVSPKLESREKYREEIRQQGEYVSLHRDLMLGFQCWEFSPLELDNPFPNNEGSVHLWHGVEDRIVPVMLSRYISQKLSWVHYHELPDAGHMFPVADGMSDAIVKALLLGNN
ncbi:uncharacterized protein LOC121971854 isoform X1 [Zingiber officinale]|uniref:uncharacterized protein LOC121971854 isoform X1 n=2 Tax=Zingiber officinale TaxID=94328 RepID=UPI001C4A8101|nr:uncharacterized protein LOC121971854 isoform X1 [Zingiber officinale]